MKKMTKSAIRLLLAICLLLPGWAGLDMRAEANGATDYTVNGNPYSWQDATLAADGDTLEIVTDDAPSSPVKIHVTAPANASVTLKGKAGKTYDNVYVEVDENITLNIENFNITAPTGDSYNGISFTKLNSPNATALNVTGSNTISGFDGINSKTNHQLTIKGAGTLTALGKASTAANTASGHGIHVLSDGTGVTQPGAKLIIEGNVKAVGGDSLDESAGSGIFLDWGNMQVKSGTVEAIGGKTNGDRSAQPYSGSIVTRRGGYGINLKGWGFPQTAGELTVEGGQLTATGGEALAVNSNGYAFEGGRGILADTSITISGGSVTTTGGISADTNAKGGDGMFSLALTISGTATTVTSTGVNGGLEGGSGMFITNDVSIEGAAVTATGGSGFVNGYGIFAPSGKITIKDGARASATGGMAVTGTSGGTAVYANGGGIEITNADLTATGGNATAAGASGGPAVYVSGDIQVTNATVSATGGNGPVNGSHGLFSYSGNITIGSGANITSIGGNGTTGVGGVGLRAFGGNSGKTVQIDSAAGNIYVRGGQGATAQRPSILGKDIYIATGNVGEIAMEVSMNPRSIKNKAGGDDVYMLTATTNPPAAATIESQVAGALGGSYTYKSPAKVDGKAFLWLPTGSQIASATNYQSESKMMPTNDTASVVLSLLPGAVVAQLEHGGASIGYPTIQSALDAAVDGDTVTIKPGTYRGQLTVTKNITLQGSGADTTMIESPDSSSLAQSSWKNLKDQFIYAVIGVKTSTPGTVNIKNITVDGRKQGYIAAHNGEEGLYTFNGIAVRDTTVTIDHVKVVDVRDLWSDYGTAPAPLPGDYVPQDQPSGANHNESILLEGAAGAGSHKVTVTNSTVSKFHKTGILGWGPTLEVDIQNNDIQGHGKTLYSTGNGIQIASSDRSGMGGANGDRRGTTGVVKNNRIYDIGLVIPEPGQPGSYLNVGLYGPSGILLYAAGEGFLIEGNTITGPGVMPWHNSDSSNDGGYSNDGIGVNYSKGVVLRNNTITGFSTGIIEGDILAGSSLHLVGNSFGGNDIDIWTNSGNDTIELGTGADTIAYRQGNNGVDTISSFGAGDRIRVVGFVDGSVNGQIGTVANAVYVTDTNSTQVINGYTDAHPVVDFTGGTITSGDGTSVAARSVQVSVTGNETTLFIDTENDTDAPELTIKLAGVYRTDNFKLNGGYIEYVPDSTISAASATFDTNTSDTSTGHYADVTTTLTANGRTLTDFKLNGVSIGSSNYSVDNSGVVTIKKEYLASLGAGAHSFTLDMNIGNDPVLTVTVSNSAAGLTGIAGQVPAAAGGGNGQTAGTAAALTLSVPYSKTVLNLADIATVTGATYKLYTDSAFSSEIVGGSTVPLSAGGSTTVYVKVTAQDAATVMYYAVTINRAAALSSDAGLVSVAGQTPVSTGGGSGTAANAAITWTVNVSYGKQTLLPADMVTVTGATYRLYTDSAFTSEITGSLTAPLAAGGATRVYVKVTSEDVTTVKYYEVTVNRAAAPNGDASLVSVGGLTSASIGGGNGGSAGAAVVWNMSVPIGTSSFNLSSIVTVTGATYKLYTDGGFTTEMTGSSSIALAIGGVTKVYIKVTAQDGTTVKYYIVSIYRAGTSSGSSTNTSNNSTGNTGATNTSTTSSTSTSKEVIVYVNGKAENAGSAAVAQVNNRTVTTIDVDKQKLEAKLAAEGKDATVTVVFTDKSDVVAGELTGEMIRKMEQMSATLELRTEQAFYKVPSLQINIQNLAAKLGQVADLNEIKVRVEISQSEAGKVKVVENAAKDGGFSVVVPPVDFSVTASYRGQSVEITDYTVYVERTIALPEGIDPNKITTAVVTEPDGSVRHVPTKITQSGGRYYATINSLTNSTYTVVWHPLEFADAAQHWSKDAVNDMGSRMVVQGTGNGLFEPDRDITRAEFAAIIVKSLGLSVQAKGMQPFRDVASDKWYNGAVQTAYAYRLITGYEDGTFRPTDNITRQEAVAIIAKAMRITGLTSKLPANSQVLAAFLDQSDIAEWAHESFEAGVQAGIVLGRSAGRIEPQAYITRAEVAAMVQRLLKNSQLI
ncbi:S-layer homology domain-containing protein [Paenibacillus thalictri]|nr:S-layer homology domain-containing protein [Paenibacillus thalictri]